MYTFKRDHLNFKAGQEVESHPNQDYLTRMGVIELTGETVRVEERFSTPVYGEIKKPVKKPKKVK